MPATEETGEKPEEEIEEAGVSPEEKGDEDTESSGDDDEEVGADSSGDEEEEEEDAGEEKQPTEEDEEEDAGEEDAGEEMPPTDEEDEEPTEPKEAGEEEQPTEEQDIGEETETETEETEGEEKPTGEEEDETDTEEETGDVEPEDMEVLKMTEKEDGLIKKDMEQLFDKEIAFENITIGGKWFSLFHEKNAEGKMEYYMKLHYGENAELTGGFKTDSLGNFIDELGNVMTSMEEISDFMKSHKFTEFWNKNEMPKALLIRKIVDMEETTGEPTPEEETDEPTPEKEAGEPTPEEELKEGETSACHCNSGRMMHSCNREQPIAVSKPLYYDNYVPTPCYKKKYIPYVVTKRCPVYIKKCVPVHIPVKIPIRVPVDVIVPCEREYTEIVPVCKTVYK